ncbi:MAG: flavodoxin family protein [Lachnospiraceae bacterium]|nr:flavodoxin family protein [Lachnospiraceae bacterium]
MKVLLLNGSPRMKGNTRMALSLVMEGIEEGLHPESLELYDVSRHKLSACLACDGCKKNGGNCVQADESAELVQKIYEADVVVFGTPVYWWGMSAQLKMAVDKLYSRTALLQEQEAKKIGLITVGAAAVDDPEYQLIEDQMKCICGHLGWNLAFSYGISAWEPGELEKKTETVEILREAWGTLE